MTKEGEKIWRASGSDIFTQDFKLKNTYIKVVDFNDEIYHIDIKTGRINKLISTLKIQSNTPKKKSILSNLLKRFYNNKNHNKNH